MAAIAAGDLVRPPPADGSGGIEVCRPMASTYLVTVGHLAQPDEGAVESASRRRQQRAAKGRRDAVTISTIDHWVRFRCEHRTMDTPGSGGRLPVRQRPVL